MSYTFCFTVVNVPSFSISIFRPPKFLGFLTFLEPAIKKTVMQVFFYAVFRLIYVSTGLTSFFVDINDLYDPYKKTFASGVRLLI